MNEAVVIGAGLAGAEAAWQIAKRGGKVILYEMRPTKMTPAHQSEYFAELVCSNSFRALSSQNAVGLLKEEMRRLDSLIMQYFSKLIHFTEHIHILIILFAILRVFIGD